MTEKEKKDYELRIKTYWESINTKDDKSLRRAIIYAEVMGHPIPQDIWNIFNGD